MDLCGVPVHHGLATMADLGLTRAAPFGRSDRRELTVGEENEEGGVR
jgi:hypothetical protein